MSCKVFFRSCIIVFSAIMDKTRNFLHCSAKTLYALNVGDSYWTIQRHNLESIHCDDRTSALSSDRKKAPSDDRSKQARLSVYSLKSLHFIKEFYWENTIQSCPWPRSDPCHHWRSPRFFFPLPYLCLVQGNLVKLGKCNAAYLVTHCTTLPATLSPRMTINYRVVDLIKCHL